MAAVPGAETASARSTWARPWKRPPPRHARRQRRTRGPGCLRLGVVVGPVVLAITVIGGGPADAAFAATVTVRSGDSLTSIAARYHTTVAALAAANNITDPNLVFAGVTLQVPTTPGPAPLAAPAAVAGPPSLTSTTVTVRPGDSLTSIAARYHTTVAALVAANNITDPNFVFAGAQLVVPGPATTSGWGPGSPLPAALLSHPDRMTLRPVFLNAATASGIAPSLLEALCWWESGWLSSAKSATGALGLCQLEPSTVNYVRLVLLHNPALNPRVSADNITMAAAYLHDLTARGGGDPHTAVAAYYQGLGSVQKRGLLPFTHTYVRGVFNYAAIFAAAG
jgi:LysM repeat protein